MESHRGFSFSSRDSEAIDIDRVQDSCSGAMWFLVALGNLFEGSILGFHVSFRGCNSEKKTVNSFVEVRVDFNLFSSLFLFLRRPWHPPHKIFRLKLHLSSWQNLFLLLAFSVAVFLQFLHPFWSERHQHETNQPATARSLSRIYKYGQAPSFAMAPKYALGNRRRWITNPVN